ncbi:hypothetical protein DFJ74DRAFT_688960 [Hyaloraphidium curvatum]|nr:hypothetical protein DFJ74DRAFT_688960 [Hyaloraphidium curvatum]
MVDALQAHGATWAARELRVQLALQGVMAWWFELYFLASLPFPLLFTGLWLLNDGRFGYRQLVAATVVRCFAFLASTALQALISGNLRRRLGTRNNRLPFTIGATLDGHPFAGFVRWLELGQAHSARGQGGEGAAAKEHLNVAAPSLLVEHDPEDGNCPCFAALCSGTLPDAAARQNTILGLFRVAFTLVFILLAPYYTPLVTFGPVFWPMWWGAFLGTLAVFSSLCTMTLSFLGSIAPILAPVRFSLRLRRRTMVLAMTSLVHRIRTAPDSLDSAGGAQEVYPALYAALAASWKRRTIAFHTAQYFGTTVVNVVVGIIVIVATGSCILQWQLWLIGWQLFTLCLDLAVLAVQNSEVIEVMSVVSDARRELLELASADPAARATGAERHAAVLGSYLGQADAFRARFLGFAIGFEMMRTLVGTFLTVAIGLWSVLRGLGVFLTLESACPSP